VNAGPWIERFRSLMQVLYTVPMAPRKRGHAWPAARVGLWDWPALDHPAV